MASTSDEQNLLSLSIEDLDSVIQEVKSLEQDFEEQQSKLEEEIGITAESIIATYVGQDLTELEQQVLGIQDEIDRCNEIIKLLTQYSDFVKDGGGEWNVDNDNINIDGIVFKEAFYYFKENFSSNWANIVTQNSTKFTDEYTEIVNNETAKFDDSAFTDYLEGIFRPSEEEREDTAKNNVANARANLHKLIAFNTDSENTIIKIKDLLSDMEDLADILKDGVVTLSELLDGYTIENMKASDDKYGMLESSYKDEIDLLNRIFDGNTLSEEDVAELQQLMVDAQNDPLLYEALMNYLEKMSRDYEGSTEDSLYKNIIEYAAVLQFMHNSNGNTIAKNENNYEYYLLEYDILGGFSLQKYIVTSRLNQDTETYYYTTTAKELITFEYGDNLEDITDGLFNVLIDDKLEDNSEFNNAIENLLALGMSFNSVTGAIIDTYTFVTSISVVISELTGASSSSIERKVNVMLEVNPAMTMVEILFMLEQQGDITEEERKYLLYKLRYDSGSKVNYGIAGVEVRADNEVIDIIPYSTHEMYEIDAFARSIYNYLHGDKFQKEQASKFLSNYMENVDIETTAYLKDIGEENVENGEALLKSYLSEGYNKNGILNTEEIIKDYSYYENFYRHTPS